MDFEKIRLESLQEVSSALKDVEPGIAKLANSMMNLSSKVTKLMLIKYHEELKKQEQE
ncbi:MULTISPECIES: hypothetical protein [Paenibacillus]|uniref:Uncharacterized protein n=1 Tax=Paenibacillus macerans TaxID=44252 RepID=A0A090ZA42_PAEMA|nr:hypothetical protein [Paenibacillus macerans]KFN07283.1 hypothetical protein DJ90_5690 [Paenibacillus macerans]MCY7558245.1 hypothetical protein [Paenibacillus macerans]MEC0154617.1 hypothetical protein [Paenibacillus macerans]SUA85650.1 Uncharacterised protein [Paenibacillus macerans]